MNAFDRFNTLASSGLSWRFDVRKYANRHAMKKRKNKLYKIECIEAFLIRGESCNVSRWRPRVNKKPRNALMLEKFRYADAWRVSSLVSLSWRINIWRVSVPTVGVEAAERESLTPDCEGEGEKDDFSLSPSLLVLWLE